MSVSSEKIQAIREQTDIVRLIGTSVALKKAGRNYVGLCPFHSEKTPSFSVSPDKAMFYCFGCHAGGDAFAFVMRHRGVDFHTAARELGTAQGIALEPETPEQRAQKEREHQTAEANRLALLYFESCLKHPSAEDARRYLRTRRIPAPFAAQRHLGFGGTHDGILAFFAARNLPVAAAIQAGLLSDDGRRQLFAGRLIFPIHDTLGRVVGFGGRRLDDDASAPKYINSRENPLFHKRRFLYGLYEAQEALRKSKRVIIVEGYTDVLAMQRAGLEETVAPLGTAFTSEHAKTCARLVSHAIVLLDADAAGQRAARLVTMQLLQAGLQAAVATLPAGEDPDSVLREHGPPALQSAVTAARPAVEYFMDQAFAGANLTIEERAQAAREMQPLLASLASGLERELYTSRLADKVGVAADQLRRHLKALPSGVKKAARGPRAAEVIPNPKLAGESLAPPGPSFSVPPVQKSGIHKHELEILRELLLYPGLRPRFHELAEFALTEEMRQLMEMMTSSEQPLPEILQAHIKDPNLVGRLSQIKPFTEGVLDEVIAKSNRTFDDVLARLKWRHLDAAVHGILLELKEAETKGLATDELLRRKQELTERKRVLKHTGRPARA